MKVFSILGYCLLIPGLGYILYTQSLLPLYHLEEKDNHALQELQQVTYEHMLTSLHPRDYGSGSTIFSGSLLSQ